MIEKILQLLMIEYGVHNYTELAKKMSTTQSTISGWKARNAIGALVDKLVELKQNDILEKIFANTSGDNQYITTANQVSMVTGTMISNSNQNESLLCQVIKQKFDYFENYGGKKLTEKCEQEILEVLKKYEEQASAIKETLG